MGSHSYGSELEQWIYPILLWKNWFDWILLKKCVFIRLDNLGQII